MSFQPDHPFIKRPSVSHALIKHILFRNRSYNFTYLGRKKESPKLISETFQVRNRRLKINLHFPKFKVH